MDDLSRPARLPSEAITLPAMEQQKQPKPRGNGALSAVRHEWPSELPQQRAIPPNWEMDQMGADVPAAARQAGGAVSMGRAALSAVLSVTRR